MSQYAVIFAGDIIPGAQLEKVKQGVAALFKTDSGKVEHLFSGEEIVLKRGLESAVAEKYLAALERVGAKASIRDESQPATPEPDLEPAQEPDLAPDPAPAAAAPVAPMTSSELPDGDNPYSDEQDNTDNAARSVVLNAPGDLGALAHAKVETGWDKIVDLPPPPPPKFNFEGLSLAAEGDTLVESKETPPLIIDTSHLTASKAKE
ncbi:MAG: hypothetical protein HQL49_02600 [Gammaproteobacteria bacterium]|nr:hypothetical protein [Gammaproteobacteria bacterium]